MPDQQSLVQIFDYPADEAAQQKLLGLLDTVEARVKGFAGISLMGKVNGAAEFKTQSAEMTAGLQQIADMQKKLIELEGQLAAAKKSGGKAAKDLTDEQLRASLKQQQDLKARKDAIKAEEDAYKQLALAYNKAAEEAKKLQAEALKGGDKGAADAATAKAKSLSDQLKGIDRPVGDDRRNVGNYLDAIKALEPELQRVRSEMDAMRKSGNQNTTEFQKLNEQFRSLEALTSQQAKGFASVTQELRFNEKALQTLRAAGLENTDSFKHMRLEVASAREEFREFTEQQKILASDAPLLTSLTVAAKGLAGAYAVGAGASALFANGNEKVEKELNRLVAVMTLLQGLQEAHELLQKRGAIAVAFSAAAQKIKNFVMTGSAEAHKVSTAAEILNTEAEVANTVATGENVVAQEGEVVATEAVTVATEGSTRAMIALRFALIATGIGALLILLPLVASGMGLFAKNAKEAAKEALELDEMIQKLNETLAKQAELEQRYLGDQREGLQESLAYAEKAGKNFYELFAIRKRLAEVDAQEAANLLMRSSGQTDINNAIRKTTDAVSGQASHLHALQVVQETMEEAFIKGSAKMSDAQKKEAKEEIENHEKVIEVAQKRYDTNLKNLTEYNEKSKVLEATNIEGEKFSEDEKRQLALVTAKVRAEAVIRANERIVGDERSTQAQVIAAMDRGLQGQLAIIEADRRAKLQDPSLTPAGRAQVILEASDAEQAAIEASNETKRKKNYEYYIRDRNARAEILKLEAEDQAKADATIIADSKAFYDNKLAALTDQFNARKKAIGVDLGRDLNTPGMTDPERMARLAKAESDLQALRIDYAKQYQQIVKENQEKILKSWEGYFQSLNAQANTQESNELTALNNSFSNKLISAGNYERKRTEIQRKAAIERAQIEVQSAYMGVNATKEGTAERQKAEERLSAAVLGLTGLVTSGQIAKTKEKDKAIIDSATAVYDLSVSLIDAGYEKELNRIQDKMNANTAFYDKEKKDITTSTLTSQQRAAELIILDKKQAEEQHRLEQQRRMEQQRQAVFDRDAAILKIFANTLVAASSAGWITPAAIAIEIMGAAQVAFLAAKQIPHYEIGTDNHPGGPMVVHPGELRIDPDGTVTRTPEKPTLTTGDPGTKIIPAHEVNSMLMSGILSSTGPLQVDRNGELIKGLSDLKQEIRRTSQEQINAFRKQKPAENHIHVDAGFLVHIQNSCN